MNKQKLIKLMDGRFFLGIAHRGLHNQEITENGLKAFQNAIDHNLAFELDVHLSKDGELIVCHDASLLRTTGKEGKIEELTAQEIRDNYRLLDGGVVPTLQEVIDLNHEQVPMVIELKAVHNDGPRLGKKCRQLLKTVQDRKKYMIISFYPMALLHSGKKIKRSLLLCLAHPEILATKIFFESLDIDFQMLHRKKIKKYHRNHLINAWTIETEEDLENYYPYSDLFTFQHLDPEYVKNRLKNKLEEITQQ